MVSSVVYATVNPSTIRRNLMDPSASPLRQVFPRIFSHYPSDVQCAVGCVHMSCLCNMESIPVVVPRGTIAETKAVQQLMQRHYEWRCWTSRLDRTHRICKTACCVASSSAPRPSLSTTYSEDTEICEPNSPSRTFLAQCGKLYYMIQSLAIK